MFDFFPNHSHGPRAMRTLQPSPAYVYGTSISIIGVGKNDLGNTSTIVQEYSHICICNLIGKEQEPHHSHFSVICSIFKSTKFPSS